MAKLNNENPWTITNVGPISKRFDGSGNLRNPRDNAERAALGLKPRRSFKSNEMNPYVLELDFSNLSLS